jgi:hypothetical protein
MISVIVPVLAFLLTVLTVLSDLKGPEKVELAILNLLGYIDLTT